MTSVEPLKIERKRLIRATQDRLWEAITDSSQFGEWFRIRVEGEFREGKRVNVVSTYPGHEGVKFFLDIVEVCPKTLFSYRWQHDETEPMTLCEFRLEPAEGGTLLTITETGFEMIALSKRTTYFERNSGGWTEQMVNIERYVTQSNAT